MPHRRGEHIRRTVTLLNSLLRGELLDANTVKKVLGLKIAGRADTSTRSRRSSAWCLSQASVRGR